MPFPFELPTTSSISFADFYTSSTHPSLPLAATTCRGVLRDVLKKHKRLPPPTQPANLPAVTVALNEYIPYLSALDAGLSPSSSSIRTSDGGKDEAITVAPLRQLITEWRATLTASPLPGRDPPRVKLQGLELELGFALATLAYAHSLQARAALRTLLPTKNAAPPEPEARTAAIAAAMRAFLEANAMHSYLAQRLGGNVVSNVPAPQQPPSVDASGRKLSHHHHHQSPAIPPDMTPAVQTALAELTLAEATLIAVLKDDPYPAVVAEDRSKASNEWMFKAPDIPRVRAHLFARLCLAAGEHAAKGAASLGVVGSKVDEALAKYLEDLKRTARGKACRFFGIDAELEGKTGEAIAWLRAARRELGFAGDEEEEEKKKSRGLASRLKKDWAEKREDRKIEKGADWGGDAGRFEEGRVVEMLEKKWVKVNDTIGVQTIPPIEPLLASMPSGREYHTMKPYKPPQLDDFTVARMRAPPELDDNSNAAFTGVEDDSGSDDDVENQQRGGSGGEGRVPVGAFPGTSADYDGGGEGDRGYY